MSGNDPADLRVVLQDLIKLANAGEPDETLMLWLSL
jgi:hypothetical protein